MFNLKTIDNKWFFTELPFYLKIFTFYVRGDLLILLPLVLIIFLFGFIDLKYMLLLLGSYIAVRYFGEMIYWFSQQFNERKYRPSYDFGLKNLDNHAIYIIMQTLSIAGVIFGAAIIFAVLLYL